MGRSLTAVGKVTGKVRCAVGTLWQAESKYESQFAWAQGLSSQPLSPTPDGRAKQDRDVFDSSARAFGCFFTKLRRDVETSDRKRLSIEASLPDASVSSNHRRTFSHITDEPWGLRQLT
jgi:hypothetical protein